MSKYKLWKHCVSYIISFLCELTNIFQVKCMIPYLWTTAHKATCKTCNCVWEVLEVKFPLYNLQVCRETSLLPVLLILCIQRMKQLE